MGKNEKKLQHVIEEARMLTKRWATSREYGFALPEIPGEFIRPEEALAVAANDVCSQSQGEKSRG